MKSFVYHMCFLDIVNIASLIVNVDSIGPMDASCVYK